MSTTRVNTAEEQAQIDAWEARPEVDIAADVAEERVARAICSADEFVDGDRWTWDDAGPVAHDEYRRMARTCLSAMPPADEALRQRVEDVAVALDIDAASDREEAEGDDLDPYQAARKLGQAEGQEAASSILRAALGAPDTSKGGQR